MPRTEIRGLNYFLLKAGGSLFGAYTQLHVSRIEFFFCSSIENCVYMK